MSWDAEGQLTAVAQTLNVAADFVTTASTSLGQLSGFALDLRDKWWGGSVLAVFFLVTHREKLLRIGKFFDQMMTKYPLAAYRRGGISDSHIQSVREILFFYCLLLMYQLVQYPYSVAVRGATGTWVDVAWWADLLIQASLVGLISQTYTTVVREVREASKGNIEKQQQMSEWLNEKLEGMHVRFKDIRWLAFGLLTASFTPAFLQFLPQFLGGVATGLRFSAKLILGE